jgi:hypothetical protein
MQTIAKLGDRIFLGTSQYLVPPNEQLKLTLKFDKADSQSLNNPVVFNLNLKFIIDNKSSQSASFLPQPDGTVDFVITNWNNPLGTSLNKPFELASFEKSHIVDIMLHNAFIGQTNFLTIQFWLREIK